MTAPADRGPAPRAGRRLGKYRLRRRIADGGFGTVFAAHDTIEGVDVALKLPLPDADVDVAEDLRREIRLVGRLDHTNVLPIRNADAIDGRLVVAYPLGDETLADRMRRRMTLATAVDLLTQMLAGLAHAHEHGVVHCDIKPENMILFGGTALRLTDFGIARVTSKTLSESVGGTLGYMAPEQALGRPSPRSDVFAAGMVIQRVLGGSLPAWPYDWPYPGLERLARVPGLPEVVRRATELDSRRRFPHAGAMLRAFKQCSAKLRAAGRSTNPSSSGGRTRRSWRRMRTQQFRRRFGKALTLRHTCAACREPVDERMGHCPWCRATPLHAEGPTTFPAQCPRCARGVKHDWRFCPWCWGASLGDGGTRRYSDRRYRASCHACHDKVLMPFMRYCPRCHAKVRRRWRLDAKTRPCRSCGNDVAADFWSCCGWCGSDV